MELKLIFVQFLNVISSECTGYCPPDWELTDGMCLRVFLISRNWENSKSSCIDEGGQLLQINNDIRQNWVKTKTSSRVWFDANDIDVEGEWRNSAGDLIRPV